VRICIGLVLFAFCSVASAADRSEKIRELMEAQGLVEMFQHQLEVGRDFAQKRADQMLDQALAGLNPPEDVKAKLRDAVHEFLQAARSPWTGQDIVDVWGKYYGSKFSDEELDQLVTYYRSPLGQKDAVASREALDPFMAEFRERYKPILDKAMQEYVARLQGIVKDCNCKK
jgi:hypothetical protein